MRIAANAALFRYLLNFTNAGNLTAQDSNVTLPGNFNNTGNISIQNSISPLLATHSGLVLGNFSHTGSTTLLSASNLSSPLDLAATPFGAASLSSNSSLTNLTLLNSAGVIDIAAGWKPFLNVTLASNLTIEPGATVSGTMSLQSAAITINSSATACGTLSSTISGNGTIAFQDTATGALPGRLLGNINAGVALTTAAGSGLLSLSNVTMAGTIVSSAHALTINNLNTQSFVNSGQMTASGGTITIYGNMTNTGTVSSTAGTITFGGSAPGFSFHSFHHQQQHHHRIGRRSHRRTLYQFRKRLRLQWRRTATRYFPRQHRRLHLSQQRNPPRPFPFRFPEEHFNGPAARSPLQRKSPSGAEQLPTTTIDLGNTTWGAMELPKQCQPDECHALTSSSGSRQILNVDHPSSLGRTMLVQRANIATDLLITPGANLTVQSTQLSNSTIDLLGSSTANATLVSSSISGNGTIRLDGATAGNSIQLSGTTGSGISIVTGAAGGTINSPATLQGPISAQTSGQPLTFTGGLSVGSTGLLQAINGDTIVSNSTLALSGTVNVGAGSSITFARTANFATAASSLTGTGTFSASTVSGFLTVPGVVNVTGTSLNNLKSLSVAGSPGQWTGLLNLIQADAIVQSTTGDASQLVDQVRQAYNNGDWLGTGGITSTTVRNSIQTANPLGLVVMTGADYTALTSKLTFDNQAFAPTHLLLTRALLGDANLDNQVDLSDLSTVLNNFGQPSLSWTAGNFDYAPTIDLTDLSDVLNNFGQTLTTPANLPSTPTPEPTSLLLLSPLRPPPSLKRRR